MRRQRLAVTAVGMLLSGVALAVVTTTTAAQATGQPTGPATIQTGHQSDPVARVLAEGDDPDDPTGRPRKPRHTPPEQLPVPCIGCP